MATSYSAHSKLVKPTKNRMGWMFNAESDEYINKFAKFVSKSDGLVADLGCAYGDSTKLALRAGGPAKIIANDMCAEHLEELFSSLQGQPDMQNRLILKPGNALDLDFSPNSLDAILAANWMHLMPPEDLRRGMVNFYEALKPGGKIFLISPSTKMGTCPDAELVEQRRRNGDLWPGYWKNELCRGPREVLDNLPLVIGHLDPEELEREAKLAGFVVEHVGYSSYNDYEMAGFFYRDGREFSGLVAHKPAVGA